MGFGASPRTEVGAGSLMSKLDPDALGAGLRALLRSYEDRLEQGTIYGIDVLHRPGARAHDWFAGVRPGKGTTKLMLLPIKSHPELLEGVSPALMRRNTGAALFTLRPGDVDLLPDLEALLTRAFDVYTRVDDA
jgi:hypothetical protein